MDGNAPTTGEEVEDFYVPTDEKSLNGKEIPHISPAAPAVNGEDQEDTVYDEVENEWEPEISTEAHDLNPKNSSTPLDFSAEEAPDVEVPEEIAAVTTENGRTVPDALDESIVEEFRLSEKSVDDRFNSLTVDETDNVEIVEEVEIVDHTQDDPPGSEAEVDGSTRTNNDSNISGDPVRADQNRKLQVERTGSNVAEGRGDPAPQSQKNDGSAPADTKKKSRSLALAEHKRKALAAEQQMQLQAEQELEAKANALKVRAAKRLEEQEKREQRELAKQRRKAAAAQRAAVQDNNITAGDMQNDEGDEEADGPHGRPGAVAEESAGGAPEKAPRTRATGSHASKIRSMVKNSKDGEGGADGGDWNDSIAAPVSASRKERHEAVEKRRQERLEARARKLAGVADKSITEGNAADEGSEMLRPYPVKPDQQQGRDHTVKRRLRPKPTLSSADGDANRLVLPPLIGAKQPRSSPNPARAALSSLLRDSEFPEPGESLSAASPSGKPRRSRKPLYLRMIEKAQAQYVEDERRKHESYVEQNKLKQKNNPTQEELRMHRRKHDELVQAKLEEGRRNLAEVAAANARALRRQQAVASAVQTALDEKSKGGLVVDGTSPLRKRQTKKKQTVGEVAGDGGGALDEMMPLPPLNSDRQKDEVGPAVDFGFSPSKSAPGNDFSDSRYESTQESRNASASPAAVVSVTAGVHSLALGAPAGGDRENVRGSGERAAGSDGPATARYVPLEFDAGAAAAAVQKIPALAPHCIPTYCASDWLDKLATADADLPATAGMSTGSSAQVLLKPVLPHCDAQRLMNIAVP